MLELKGQITISHTSGGEDGTEIRIRIEDDDAGVTACEVQMSLENYALVLTNQGCVDCKLLFNDSGKVGTLHESKTELVPIPKKRPHENKNGWIEKALAPFAVDGWVPRGSDMQNHHCWSRDEQGNEFQRVVFFRNVPKAKESTNAERKTAKRGEDK